MSNIKVIENPYAEDKNPPKLELGYNIIQGMSGSGVQVVLEFPANDYQSSVYFVAKDILTVSHSVSRSKLPVTNLGEASMSGMSIGSRMVAGSIIKLFSRYDSLSTYVKTFVATRWDKLNEKDKQDVSTTGTSISFKEFSDRLMQQYGITVKESRGQLSYLPAGRTKFIRAKHLGDKFDKAAVLATLQANAERKPKAQFKQDTIGKLIDIQSRMTEGKGIGYKRWLTKHNLKVMAQTVKLLQEKGLTDEDALNQRIAELETKYHDSLAVVKDLEGRMKANKELRYHIAAYTSTKNVAQQLKTAKRPAAFEEQHRAELTAYRAAAAYFKANNITKLPSPKKLEAEYAQLASEKAKFYEQYKEAKEELLKLKTAKQNVASFFREEEPTQQER